MLAIYTRLSKLDDSSTSIKNQLREGKQFAEKHELEYKIYNEGEGVSGTSPLTDRPAFKSLLDDIIDGEIKLVWSRNQNRISRNRAVFGKFLSAVDGQKVRVFFSDAEYDLADPTAKLILGIFNEFNTYQVELQSVQIKKALLGHAKEGKTTGNCAYGYMADENNFMVVHHETSEVVKQIFQDYVNRLGTVKIADKLNEMGIPTPFKKSRRWFAAAINFILKNTAYIGQRRHRDNIFDCPSIIDKRTFEKVQEIMKERGVLTKGRANRDYLLSGFMKCGKCDLNYVGRRYSYKKRRNKVYHYYRCNSHHHRNDTCKNKPIKQEVLEDFIWDIALDHEKLFERVKESLDDTSNKKKLEENLIHHNDKLKNLDTEWKRVRRQGSKGILSDDEMIEEKTRIDRERESILKDIDFDEEELRRIKIGSVMWETEYIEGTTHLRIKKGGNRINTIKNASKNERKRLMHELIREITIDSNDDFFTVEVSYNLPIDANTYFIDKDYTGAYLEGEIIEWIAPDLNPTAAKRAAKKQFKEVPMNSAGVTTNDKERV